MTLDGVNMTKIAAMSASVNAIVVCIGETAYTEKPGDIDSVALPEGQTAFVKALASLGPPVITVLVMGRPRLLSGAAEASTAVLHAYLPGPMGGRVVAEVLAGVVVPSGRLPFTYPKHEGDIPYPYYHKPGDQCIGMMPCQVSN